MHSRVLLLFASTVKRRLSSIKQVVKEHEKGCDDNPNKPPKPKCRLCGKEFTVRRSLKRHMDSAHEGAPISDLGVKVHGLCMAGWEKCAMPVSRSAFLSFLAGHPSHVPGRYHQM